jgi:hypothetical protein
MRTSPRSIITALLLLGSSFFGASAANAQFKEDTTETNQEGFIMYNSHLSMGFAYFQAEGFTTAHGGLSYEAGVSVKYQKGHTAYDLSLFASSRCASLPEAGVTSLRLTYLMLSPSFWTKQGLLNASLGMAFGLPVRAGSKTHTEQHAIALGDIGPLAEFRGKLEFDLSRWLPFNIFVVGTYPLNKTGEIDLGHRTVSGRSSTIQIGISTR